MNKYNFQVGDYCRHADGTIAIVAKVEKGRGFACKIGNSEYLWSYNNRFEPIPITEEWLELNSIHLDKTIEFPNEEEFKYWYSRDHRLMITNLSNAIYGGFSADVRMFKAHMDNDHFETIGSLDVQYVHQLLHLCRDCDYEFEPKFK